MALNPVLQAIVERSQVAHPKLIAEECYTEIWAEADTQRREVERLEAELRLAKAAVKTARLEVRLVTAKWAQAEAEARLDSADCPFDRAEAVPAAVVDEYSALALLAGLGMAAA